MIHLTLAIVAFLVIAYCSAFALLGVLWIVAGIVRLILLPCDIVSAFLSNRKAVKRRT